MARRPKSRKIEMNETDPSQVTGRPTQAQGIRQAQEEKNPADPTRRVHPDSVPLEGAPQPSRRDQVMPSAEPVVPDIDRSVGASRKSVPSTKHPKRSRTRRL